MAVLLDGIRLVLLYINLTFTVVLFITLTN